MTHRTESKKLRRQLNIGDYVTWGNGLRKHKIVDITNDGIVVDVTDEPECDKWSAKQSDGRFFYGVCFHSNGSLIFPFIQKKLELEKEINKNNE